MERKWWTLLAISIATFMLLLDVTIVNVALPSIQRDLHTSLASLQWIVDAYALTLAAFLLTAGSLGDRLGRRRVFTFGLALFTLASLLCGISGGSTLLNLARALQGVGASAMFATSLALIGQEFHGRDRATAFGVWGATVGGAVAIGPLAGGLLTQGLGWQWIFFVNVPIGVVSIVLTESKIANVAAQDPSPLDLPGQLCFSASLFLIIWSLIRGNQSGWGSASIVGTLAGGGALMLAFLVVELRSSRSMLDLSLLRKPAFVGALVAAFVLAAGVFAILLYMTIYLQGVTGYGPLGTGVRFLPLTLASFLASPISARLSNHVPQRVLIGAGLALAAAGLLVMRGAITVSSGWTSLLPGFIMVGTGAGIANPGIGATSIAVVPAARSGMGAGVNQTFRQVGLATGVAGLGAIFQSQVVSNFGRLLPGARPGLAQLVYAGGSRAAAGAVPPAQRHVVAHVGAAAFTAALNDILLICAVLGFIGAAVSLALIRSRDFVVHGQSAQAGAEEPLGATALRA